MSASPGEALLIVYLVAIYRFQGSYSVVVNSG